MPKPPQMENRVDAVSSRVWAHYGAALAAYLMTKLPSLGHKYQAVLDKPELEVLVQQVAALDDQEKRLDV